MSFDGLLSETAVVFRRQSEPEDPDDPDTNEEKTDPFGQPTRDEEEHHRFACRITSGKGGDQFSERARDVIVTTHRFYAEPGEDLLETDVVTVLSTAGDVLLEKGAVGHIERPRDGDGAVHHIQVTISEQRNATTI